MLRGFCGILAVAVTLCVGCGDDGAAGEAPKVEAMAGAASDGTMTGGAGAAAAADRCAEGCRRTLTAACSNGPADQASCESTCHTLEAGACGAEYEAFQDCAEGKTVSCSGGIPVVEDCADAQAAFIACINR
jgi:hypothetical protein